MKKDDITINTYNKSAKKFAKWWEIIETTKKQIKEAFSMISKENPKVLELGCGNGRDAKYILNLTNDYLGMDASSELIKIAKKECPNANFVISKYEDFNFPQNTDIIFALASLLHCSKKEVIRIFKKCAQSLNKNGIMYLTLQYDSVAGKERKDDFGTRIFYYYTPEEIKEITNNDFEIVKMRKHIPDQPIWFDIYLRKK